MYVFASSFFFATRLRTILGANSSGTLPRTHRATVREILLSFLIPPPRRPRRVVRLTQRAFQPARYVIFRGDRLQRSRESRAINVIIRPLPFAVAVPFLSSPGSATRGARRLARHVTDTGTPHPHAGTRETRRCNISPADLVGGWTIAPFPCGTRGPTSRFRSQRRCSSVFFPPGARPTAPLFTGALSAGYDHLARRRVTLYHPAQQIIYQNCPRKCHGAIRRFAQLAVRAGESDVCHPRMYFVTQDTGSGGNNCYTYSRHTQPRFLTRVNVVIAVESG